MPRMIGKLHVGSKATKPRNVQDSIARINVKFISLNADIYSANCTVWFANFL